MIVVAGKGQVTPSLVDVASFAERLSKRSVTGDHVKPVSSTSAHVRPATTAIADAAADARHEASVRRAYVTLGLKDIARIFIMPFPASVNKAAGATNSVSEGSLVKNTHALRRPLNRGPKIATWIPGWDLPLHKSFMRVITRDKSSTADMTTLIY